MQIQNGVDVFFGQGDLLLMMSEPVVQDIDNGHYEDVEEAFEGLDEATGVVPNGDFMVPCTVGLWDDLAEDDNGAGGDDDGQVLGDQFV